MPVLQDDVEIERSGQSLSAGLTTPISPLPNPERIIHLCGRLNYQTQIRLGYAEAISVLYRHLEDLPNQSSGINLSSFIPSSDIRSLPEKLELLVDALGLETSVIVLENASIHRGVTTHDLGGSSGGIDEQPVDNSRGPSGEPFPRAPSLLGAASRTRSYATHGTSTNCDRQNHRRRPGRGGAFRCDQCRKAKRGWQVVSLKTSVNRSAIST